MLFLICCVWAVTSVLAYVLIRGYFIEHGHEWLNRDRALWLIIGVLFGPVLLIVGLILLFCDIAGKNFREWFKHPSRW
jgi:NADH:ubiquinone oxidoreductase subunit 5 (subunit L)/multisubunit Na+/H+ antiporter MnhA subunit